MKFVYTLSLDTANLKKNVKQSISNKSVTIFRTAVKFKLVIKDILKDVKSMAVKLHAVSKVIVSFKCDQCNYSCERPNTLKKHVNTKHTVHKCSLCSEEFTT